MKEAAGGQNHYVSEYQQATFLSSIKSEIHGLEDIPLEPILHGDFLNLIFELTTEDQSYIIEKAHQLIKAKKAQKSEYGVYGGAAAANEDQFGVNQALCLVSLITNL